MSQYLLYSTLANQIKDEMAGQFPNEAKILRAVNAEVRNLNTKYDIETSIRSKDVSIITDGSTEYAVDTLITELDARKIKSIRYTTSEHVIYELENVEYDSFMNDVESYGRRNQFTVYTKNGVVYLRVSTNRFSDTVEALTIRYLTSNLAIDASANFYPEILSAGTLYVLVPDTYLDLICLGAQKRLFYQAIGESDATQVALVRNRYESELKKLGLSDVAQMIERKSNKIKMHRQW